MAAKKKWITWRWDGKINLANIHWGTLRIFWSYCSSSQSLILTTAVSFGPPMKVWDCKQYLLLSISSQLVGIGRESQFTIIVKILGIITPAQFGDAAKASGSCWLGWDDPGKMAFKEFSISCTVGSQGSSWIQAMQCVCVAAGLRRVRCPCNSLLTIQHEGLHVKAATDTCSEITISAKCSNGHHPVLQVAFTSFVKFPTANQCKNCTTRCLNTRKMVFSSQNDLSKINF